MLRLTLFHPHCQTGWAKTICKPLLQIGSCVGRDRDVNAPAAALVRTAAEALSAGGTDLGLWLISFFHRCPAHRAAVSSIGGGSTSTGRDIHE